MGGGGSCRYDVKGSTSQQVGFWKIGLRDTILFKWRLQNGKMGFENVGELKQRRRVSFSKVGCIAVRYAATFRKNMLPPLEGHLPWWCRQLARLKRQYISTRQHVVIFIVTTMRAHSLSRYEQQLNFLTGAISIRTKTVLFGLFRKVGQVSWLINALISQQRLSESTALAW
jgi:hypothetical protein